MAAVTILETWETSGFDWHDTKSVHSCLMKNGSYFWNPETIDTSIADMFAEEVSHMFHLYADRYKELYELALNALKNGAQLSPALKGETFFTIEGDDMREEESGLSYEFDGRRKKITYYAMGGQYSSELRYVVTQMAEEDVRYVAIKSYLCPTKGVPCVERFYTPPSRTLEEAQRALQEIEASDENSIKYISIIDAQKYSSTWYKRNIYTIEEMKKNPALKDEIFALELPDEKEDCV